MRKQTLGLITSILLVVIFIMVGTVWSREESPAPASSISPTAFVEPTPEATPTPTETEIVGEIEDIQKVEYKDADALSVNGTNVYILDTTRIVDTSGRDLAATVLEEGVAIIAYGTPSEGGIDASTITVVILPDITPR